MKKSTGHNFRELFSPLDLVTILYVLITGIYLCFNPVGFNEILPHLGTRVFVLILILCLSYLSRKSSGNKIILFVKNLYPLLFLGFFYTETSFMKNIIFETNLDQVFVNLEQSLWKCQPSLDFSRVMGQGWFNELMNICYFSYYLLIGVVCIFLYLKAPAQSQKAVFIVTFSFYLYYLIFAVFPVVGPQYFIVEPGPGDVPPYFFGKIMHTIIVNLEEPTGAFPSSHVGIAIIVSYVSRLYNKKLFYVILPFVIGICFATVYIKAHYVVDVLAGIISAPLFIFLSLSVYNKILPSNSHKKGQFI